MADFEFNQHVSIPFPLTEQESRDIVEGYRDGWAGRPPCLDSPAYAWGRSKAAHDRDEDLDGQRREFEALLVARLGPSWRNAWAKLGQGQ